MEFRCGARNTSMTITCINGVCAFDDIRGEHCICNDGWRADNVGFWHVPSCTLPNKFLEIFFIVYTVLFFVTQPLVLRKIRFAEIRGIIGKVCLAALMWAWASWFHTLAVYLQDGLFEAGLVMFAIIGIIGFWLAKVIIPMLFVPIARRAGWVKLAENIDWSARLSYYLQVLYIIGICSAAIALCRDVNPWLFNLVMLVNISEQALMVIVASVWVLTTCNNLKRMVPREVDGIQEQLRVIGKAAKMMVIGGSVTILASAIFAVFHNLPFIWVVWMLMNANFIFIMILQVSLADSLISKPYIKTTQSKHNIMRHDNMPVGASDDVDSEPSTVNDGTIITPILGLGIVGSNAMKWRPKFNKGTDNGADLSRITEAGESSHQSQMKSQMESTNSVVASDYI